MVPTAIVAWWSTATAVPSAASSSACRSEIRGPVRAAPPVGSFDTAGRRCGSFHEDGRHDVMVISREAFAAVAWVEASDLLNAGCARDATLDR